MEETQQRNEKGKEKVGENYNSWTSHPKKRHFRTKTLVDYNDLRVVIIEDYVFDENNIAFVQSEHEPSHQASPLEQSMSPLSFQNMGSKIPSKSTNYKKRNKSDYEEKSNIWDAINEIPELDSFAHYKTLALLNTKIKKDAFLKMSLEERAAWIPYTLE
ncbi:hypothetical protein ACOSP7_022480 [Xanthoceras sorbifolium]